MVLGDDSSDVGWTKVSGPHEHPDPDQVVHGILDLPDVGHVQPGVPGLQLDAVADLLDTLQLLGAFSANHDIDTTDLLDFYICVGPVVDGLDGLGRKDTVKTKVREVDFLIDLRPFHWH